MLEEFKHMTALLYLPYAQHKSTPITPILLCLLSEPPIFFATYFTLAYHVQLRFRTRPHLGRFTKALYQTTHSDNNVTVKYRGTQNYRILSLEIVRRVVTAVLRGSIGSGANTHQESLS